jgi:hypothetical protein
MKSVAVKKPGKRPHPVVVVVLNHSPPSFNVVVALGTIRHFCDRLAFGLRDERLAGMIRDCK